MPGATNPTLLLLAPSQQFDTTRIANGRDTPQIPDFDGTRGHASFEKAREDVDQTSVVNITAHHSPPLQLTPQRSREQELDNRLATMREEVNRLRALLAAMPEPTAKEEEPQSEPNGVGRCHRTTSAVAGTEAEVGIYVDEPHHPEAIPSQIIIGTQTNDNRRIDLDPRVWSSSATNPPRVNSPSPSDSSAELARELRDRINSFVQTGAGNSAAHTLTEDCKIFFQENSSADVRSYAPPPQTVMRRFNVDDDISSIKIFTLHINSSIASFLVIIRPLTIQPMRNRRG